MIPKEIIDNSEENKLLSFLNKTLKAGFELVKVIWKDGKPVVGDVVKAFNSTEKGGVD